MPDREHILADWRPVCNNGSRQLLAVCLFVCLQDGDDDNDDDNDGDDGDEEKLCLTGSSSLLLPRKEVKAN